ncbi:expressed unknown protein [Seminavis robusta]|uniref:Uncharacterized protein n=1 Tax=Seminavis robusta TaxID=568900 RepID=A0A9N8E8V3_9STRA|nr:expressed unknown protein [Seminavis robusta]|eukprot:Sro676_g185640.1 n/a (214) ;mRNA; f:17299-17940
MTAKTCSTESEQDSKIDAVGTLEGRAHSFLVPYEYTPVVTGLVFTMALPMFHQDVADLSDTPSYLEVAGILFGAISTGTSLISTIIWVSGLIRATTLFSLRIEPQAAMTFLCHPSTAARKRAARVAFLISMMSLILQECCRAAVFLPTRVGNVIIVIFVASIVAAMSCAAAENKLCDEILASDDYTKIDYFMMFHKAEQDKSRLVASETTPLT